MYFKKYITLFFILFASAKLIGQQKTPVTKDDPERFNSLMLSVDYSSNTGVSGIYSTNVKQPSYNASVSFFSKYGFDISSMLFIVDNADTSFSKPVTQFDLTLGYEFQAGEYFSIYPGYSRFFSKGESSALKSAYTDNLQLDVNFDYNFYTAVLAGSYLLGESSNTPILSFQNYFLLDNDAFLFKNLYVAIQPGFDLTWSTQTYFSNQAFDYITSGFQNRRSFFSKNQDLWIRYQWIKTHYPDVNEKRLLYFLTRDYIEVEEKFNWNSYSLILPVYFMFHRFSINLSGIFYKPLNLPEYMDKSGQFYINAGMAYMLSW